MTKIYLFALALLCSIVSIGQVSITSLSNSYSQNFNTLATSGTSSTLPDGWLLYETGSNANTTYGVSNGAGSGLAGNTYSFGANADAERALGSIRSGNLVPSFGVGFTNNTGSTITSVTVSYTGEQWRLGTTGRADRLDFQYSTTAGGISSGTFTDVNDLDFSSPVTTGTNESALNGNAAANRTSITYTISNLSISNGGSFYFRWLDADASGADDGLAIDDVSVTFNGTAQPACVAPTAQPTGIAFSNVTSTAFDVNFTAASPAADNYIALISTDNALNATPSDGSAYDVDDVIGNAIVAYRGAGTSFSETNLTPGTTYYVYIFSLNNANCSGSPIYNTASPATSSQATAQLQPCATPVTQVSNVVFSSISSTSIGGSFTTATDADNYLVVVSTNATLGFTPVDGTAYAVGSAAGNGTVIKYGSGNTFSASNLTANTTYYFSFFSLNNTGCAGGPAYNSTPVNANSTTNNNSTGIPTGYYDAVNTQTCSTLKTVLKTRTASGYTARGYNSLWSQYLVSDVKPREVGSGSANVIWDVYSDNPTGTDPYNFTPGTQQDGGGAANSEGILYNREHSVPLSWFGGETSDVPGNDYLHIYPTDKYVNAQRGSWIYGEITNPTTTFRNGSKLGPNAFAGLNGTSFEPVNEYKGDLARSFFYFITRYEDLMPNTPSNSNGAQAFEQNTYPSVDNAYLRLMIKWHEQDPVSSKEINRNNAAYTYQGNRNPYIDHPEYVSRVWNGGCAGVILPVDIISFKGALAGSKVVLSWNVSNETNLQQYIIERSENGRLFTAIGSVTAANLNAYEYNDNISSLTGRRLYYRLKKQDKDGKFSYSAVFTLHVPARLSFTIYPNPVANGVLNVQLAKAASANSYLQVLDIAGKVYQQVPVSNGTLQLLVNLKSLASGTYLVKFTDADGSFTTQKIQVQ